MSELIDSIEGIETTTIVDKRGTPHRYETVPFPAADGFNLMSRIGTIIGGPLGELINAVKGSSGDVDVRKLVSDPGAVDLDALDGSALGMGLQGVAQAIVAQGGSQLLLTILRNTTRDKVRLAKASEFDRAYAANYGELFKAVAWVLKVNFSDVFDLMGNHTGPAT